MSCPHAGNCLPQLQVSSGGPTSYGAGCQQHLSALQLRENLTAVTNRPNVIVWDKVGLGVCFAPCDEILSPSLGVHVCLLFLSYRLCILVIDPGSSRVFSWRSAVISVGLWGHKNYPDSLAKTKVFLGGGSGVFSKGPSVEEHQYWHVLGTCS